MSLVVAGRTLGVPELSSVVVIVAGRVAGAGQVDLLVVTRDVWSLRFNTNFEYQGNALTLMETSLSENNLFGWRKFLSVRFNRDQGTYDYGPTTSTPTSTGRGWCCGVGALLHLARDRKLRGRRRVVSLHYPLYSLATKWGGGVDVIHQNVVFRGFRVTACGWWTWRGRRRRAALRVPAPRADRRQRAPCGRGQRGHPARDGRLPGRRAQLRRAARLSGDALTARAVPEAVGADHRAEIGTVPALRDVHAELPGDSRSRHFELRENRRLGPSLRLRIGQGLPELGADFRALSLAAVPGYAVGPGGSYMSASASAAARRLQDDGRWIDQVGNVTVYAASPMVGRLFRIVVGGQVDSQRADTTNTPFVLGGANGCAAMRSTNSSGRRRWWPTRDPHDGARDLVPARRRRALLRRRRRRAVVRRLACTTTSASARAG